MGMDFIEGMEFIDLYITDEALYVMERLMDLDEVRDYSTVRNIIFFANNRDESNNRVVSEQEGITFNQIVDIRIFVDETVRDILRFLGRIIGFVKLNEFDIMINMVIGEWIKEEEHNKTFDIKYEGGYGANFANFGEMTYLSLRIRKDLWDIMKDVGKRKGLNMEECLKLAVIRFLERRYNLVRKFLM